MRDITSEILELIRRTSSSLPKDVEDRLRASIEKEEPGSAARGALETIVKNIELSRANSTPICQDTGTPIFYIHYPEGSSTRKLREQVRAAMVDDRLFCRRRSCFPDRLGADPLAAAVGGGSLEFSE